MKTFIMMLILASKYWPDLHLLPDIPLYMFQLLVVPLEVTGDNVIGI